MLLSLFARVENSFCTGQRTGWGGSDIIPRLILLGSLVYIYQLLCFCGDVLSYVLYIISLVCFVCCVKLSRQSRAAPSLRLRGRQCFLFCLLCLVKRCPSSLKLLHLPGGLTWRILIKQETSVCEVNHDLANRLRL